MNPAEDNLDRLIERYQGQDLAGIRVRDLVALKALLVELREGSEPPPFNLSAHVERVDARGDVRREFARRATRSVL